MNDCNHLTIEQNSALPFSSFPTPFSSSSITSSSSSSLLPLCLPLFTIICRHKNLLMASEVIS